MKKLLFLSTALVAFGTTPAEAAPVAFAVATTIGSALVGSAITGAVISWAAVMGQAALAAVLAGAQMLMARNSDAGRVDGTEITLNRVQPVTTGLILYGERTLGGSITARSTTAVGGKRHKRYHCIIPLACHEIEGAQEIWLGETLVWTAAQYAIDEAAATLQIHHWGQISNVYQQNIGLVVHNGSDTQAAEGRYVGAASEWAATAWGRGIAYVYFEADFDRDLFSRGPEKIRVRARGKRVYDPRDSLTKFTSNPFLCARDYVLTPESRGGIGWGLEDVDDTALIALANLADEQIPLTGGGTEARFAFNGVLDTAATPKTNLDRLSTAWGGWWTVEGGQLHLGGGSYEVPSFDIRDADLRGVIRTKARRDFDQQFNVVKAVFADPAAEHVPTDLPVLSSNVYTAEDNGEELIKDLGEFPGETGHARGQRLQKLALLKGRRQRTVEFPCTLAAWNVKLGATVTRTNLRRGWIAKEFEVAGKNVFIGPGNVGVTLSVIETGPEIFDWQTSEETAYVAGPRPSLYLPTDKPIVGIPALSEVNYIGRTGGVKTKVTISADSDNPFVDFFEFSLREENEISERIQTSAVSAADFEDVAPGQYVLGARAKTMRGVWSEWTYSGSLEVYGIHDTPNALTGLSVAVVAGMATLRWDRSPDIDVRQGGEIEIRHSGAQDATWQTSSSIGKAVPGGATLVTVPAMSGTYLIRPTDSQGLAGLASALNTNAPDMAAMTSLATITEHPAFAGVKRACTVNGAALELDASKVLATYFFDGAIDFATEKTVRITAGLQPVIAERSDLFDSGELFDSPELFDGGEGADGDIVTYYATTAGDPGAALGAPVYEYSQGDLFTAPTDTQRSADVWIEIDCLIPADPEGVILECGGSGIGFAVLIDGGTGDIVFRMGSGGGAPITSTAIVTLDPASYIGKRARFAVSFDMTTDTLSVYWQSEINPTWVLQQSNTATTFGSTWSGSDGGGVGLPNSTIAGNGYHTGDDLAFNGDIYSVRFYHLTPGPASFPAWSDWQPFDRTDVSARALMFRADLTATAVDYLTAANALSVIAEQQV